MVADDHKLIMSQPSVSKTIHRVTAALNKLLKKYVKFPRERRLQEIIKAEFHDYCGLPGVLGAIDCTHVALTSPTDDGYHHEKNYVNRRNYHSINVQLVSDMQQKILNAVAKFPGSCHDAFIWRSSNLRSHFAHGNIIHGNGWLLGDSGYPRETWLKVPFLSPRTPAEEAFNTAQARGRAVVERLNGTLKSRFRCLKKERTLHYTPTMACKIIYACIVLHNICVENNLYWDDEPLTEEDQPFNTGNGADYE